MRKTDSDWRSILGLIPTSEAHIQYLISAVDIFRGFAMCPQTISCFGQITDNLLIIQQDLTKLREHVRDRYFSDDENISQDSVHRIYHLLYQVKQEIKGVRSVMMEAIRCTLHSNAVSNWKCDNFQPQQLEVLNMQLAHIINLVKAAINATTA